MKNNSLFELQRWQLEKEYAAQVQAAKEVGADTTAIVEIYEKTKTELTRQETEARLSLAAGMAGDLAALLGEGTVAGKMAASAQTAINTYQAAMGAYALTPLLRAVNRWCYRCRYRNSSRD